MILDVPVVIVFRAFLCIVLNAFYVTYVAQDKRCVCLLCVAVLTFKAFIERIKFKIQTVDVHVL